MVWKPPVPPVVPPQTDPDPSLICEKPYDYIERTKPEDPSCRAGQLTRDNVTPAIPSVKRGVP